MTNYHDPAWTEESRFRGALDDVIIIPLVFLTLAADKILRFILAILMRLLDYAFPLAMQIVWLPLFAAKVVGNVIVTVVNGALRFFPLSETKRRQWSISIRQSWSWLRRKISYRAFEQAVHIAFESGMAWVFRECRHLTPNTALLVILGAALWLPISFGVATAMHAVLFAKVTSWPAWMQLLHPLATVIAKSKLLVLPVYPAAWPQAKKHPFVQLILKSYETIKRLYVIKKVGFRYRQAEIAGIAAVARLERTGSRIGDEVAARGACRRTARRRKAHSEIAFVLLAMVDQVLSRILRSEGTASLRCPIIKQQQVTNAEMIINVKAAKMLSVTLESSSTARPRRDRTTDEL